MDSYSQNKIDKVSKAVEAIYDRIDACRDSYDIDKVLSDGSDTYDFILDELVEELVNFVQALYWARERGEELAYPMRSRTEPHPAQKEYFTELNKAIKEAPEKARIRKLTKEIDELPNFLNNEFAKGFNKCTE